MIIAQITDLHITPPGTPLQQRVDTNHYAALAVNKILGMNQKPDVLLITGDLVEHGAAAEYQALRTILAPLNIPTYVIPGNHDDRDGLRASFSDHHYLPKNGFLHYAIDLFPVRLIGLDSVIPRHTEGELCAARLAWLEARLCERKDLPTLIFVHHPPFRTGLGHMDSFNLRNGDELGRVVARHPQVIRVVSGHVHRAIQTQFAHTIALTCPSTAHQIDFNLRHDAPVAFIMEPPALMLHLWHNECLTSHTLYTGDYDGPHVYA